MKLDWSHAKAEDLVFMHMMHGELLNARIKFPNQSLLTSLAAAIEELGETSQAILKEEGPQRIQEEAIQTAVMAMRIAIDCGLAPLNPDQAPKKAPIIPLRVVKPDDGGDAA
jgi:hypothetical protein